MSKNDLKKPFYKRWWIWVGGILIIVIIVSSSTSPYPKKIGSTVYNSDTEQTSVDIEQGFKIGDKVQLGDYILTVNEAKDCVAKNRFMAPSAGNKFVYVDITQENDGMDSRDYNLWDFKLQDDKDFTYQTAMASCKEPGFSSGSLGKGQKTRGFITFEIPKENNLSMLIFSPIWLSSDQIVIDLK